MLQQPEAKAARTQSRGRPQGVSPGLQVPPGSQVVVVPVQQGPRLRSSLEDALRRHGGALEPPLAVLPHLVAVNRGGHFVVRETHRFAGCASSSSRSACRSVFHRIPGITRMVVEINGITNSKTNLKQRWKRLAKCRRKSLRSYDFESFCYKSFSTKRLYEYFHAFFSA